MRAATAAAAAPPAAKKPDREGIVAHPPGSADLDPGQGNIRELQLHSDELTLEPAFKPPCRRSARAPFRASSCWIFPEISAPIAELSAARSVGGADLKVLAFGTVNDVSLFRDLLAAGASDYLVKPLSREALALGLEKQASTTSGGPGSGLGQIIAFIGSRGGVGTTTTAVGCAWLLAEKNKENTALVDLDLHFGTVALNLDADPGTGLCEALEQPSRIDALFVDRAMVKASETLRILASEASVGETLMIDAGAIDVLLYELRRKFTWIVASAALVTSRSGSCWPLQAGRHRLRAHIASSCNRHPPADPAARTRAPGPGADGRCRRQRRAFDGRKGRV